MSGIDGGVRKLLRDNLPKPDWRWTPVESGGTHGGIPDSFWAHAPSRTSGWVECKKTLGWSVELRPHQLAWLKNHTEAGVRCAIAVRALGAGSSDGTGDSLWLVRGEAADRLAELGLQKIAPEDVLIRCVGSPRSWDWAGVALSLTAGHRWETAR